MLDISGEKEMIDTIKIDGKEVQIKEINYKKSWRITIIQWLYKQNMFKLLNEFSIKLRERK